jgi:hypothetical protein
LLIWIRGYKASPEIDSCGGKIKYISNISPDFKSCSASKDLNIDCKLVFPPVLTGDTSWVMGPDSAMGKYVELSFSSKYLI